MPHKPRQSGIPPVQDCYKRIPLPIIHPPSVTLSFPCPSNTNVLDVTFSTAVVISAKPAWTIITGNPGPAAVIETWSTVNLQTYAFVLDQVLNGPVAIQVPAGDLSIQSRPGGIVANGTYACGNATIPACKCPAIKQILTAGFAGGANGSATLISLGNGLNWQGPGFVCGGAIQADLLCLVTNEWHFTFVPVSTFPPICDGTPGVTIPADNCDQLVFDMPIGGPTCPCSSTIVTIPLR